MTNMSKHQVQQEQRQRLILRSRSESKKTEESIEYGRRNPIKNLFHMSDVMSPSANHKSMNRMNRMNLEWYDNVRQSI